MRNLEAERTTNLALEALCKKRDVTFIDFWVDFQGVTTLEEHTFDGLHLMASGYQIWCKKIAPYVGRPTINPDDTQSLQQHGGLGRSYGMRNTYFSMYPIHEGDVHMIGDEMIHGGEWHELLANPKVKNRGTGWGYPGPNLLSTLQSVPVIFRKLEGQPKQIYIYAGAGDVNGNIPLTQVMNTYKALVRKIREFAPQTRICILGLLLTDSRELSLSRVVQFNHYLSFLAVDLEDVEYVDFYEVFSKDHMSKNKYFMGKTSVVKGMCVWFRLSMND